jgi:hypothetical protein
MPFWQEPSRHVDLLAWVSAPNRSPIRRALATAVRKPKAV